MASTHIHDLLRAMDLFQALNPFELEQVVSVLRERQLHEGEVLWRQGEPAEAMFIILSGRIQLAGPGRDGGDEPPTQLGAGDSFGEMAMLASQSLRVSVYALTSARVLVLNKTDLERLFVNQPRLMRNMLAIASKRAVSANRELLAEGPERDRPGAQGRVLAVFSPRGGSGKTTLSIGLAARISAGQADRTALLDLDLLFDDVGLLLGLDRQASLAEVHAQALDSFDRTALNEYLVRSAEGLRVMVSANRPEDGERLTAGHVRAALGALKQEFPVIVVDCGGSFAEPTLTALELADRVLLVCTPEMTTLRDARECQRLFGQGMHFSREKLYYVLNHPLPVRGLTREQFELALERPMAVEVPHAGVDLGSHLESHQLTDLARGRGPFGQAMERMCRDLIPAAGAGRGGPARSGVPAGRHRLLSRFRAR